ncbi:agmatinase [Pseudomaricurvus sp. HS19]|uniref:agmatinase n=1 Tax=Pseudomaricurvus sp. HS19 TaxID=2692626 RepID=UPI001F024B3B|nr:agmatinase [Pseudomaricurvus sp. HS19]
MVDSIYSVVGDCMEAGDSAFRRQNPYGTIAEPTYSGALSFMRRRYSRNLEGVDVAVFGLPYDLAVSNRPGTRFGPRAIRAASTNLCFGEAWPWYFDPFDRLHVVDYGDCVFDHGRPAQIPEQIKAFVQPILQAGVTPLAMGGDHFITYPVLQALREHHGTPISLIHFDAHCDTWADEDGRIDHGTMFYHAAKQGVTAPERSIQLGMRTTNHETHGYEVKSGEWLHRNGIPAAIEAIRSRVGDHPCYITFDVDFLDPSVAPGTGTPVCGGFNMFQAIELMQGMKGLNIVGMDVVEVSPPYDHAEMTALAGATLAHNMLCLFAHDKPEVSSATDKE